MVAGNNFMGGVLKWRERRRIRNEFVILPSNNRKLKRPVRSELLIPIFTEGSYKCSAFCHVSELTLQSPQQSGLRQSSTWSPEEKHVSRPAYDVSGIKQSALHCKTTHAMRSDRNGLVIFQRRNRKCGAKLLCDILQIWISTPNSGKIESQICRVSGAEKIPTPQRRFRRDTSSKALPSRYSSCKAVHEHEGSVISAAPVRHKIGGSHTFL